ncbi:hypothetical protein C6366_10080 [Desulfonatronum sp. SC1]|nr:hypothetical protein C6366_10080 [Desulfonatronum sp. SC1]
MKNSQLPRRRKKLKLSRINKYSSTLSFFCSLHLGFLNGLSNEDFFNTQVTLANVFLFANNEHQHS